MEKTPMTMGYGKHQTVRCPPSELDLTAVAGGVASDAVPHLDGCGVCEGVNARLVGFEIIAESLRIFLNQLNGHSLDVCRPDVTHMFTE